MDESILLIDDEIGLLEMLQLVLEKEGFKKIYKAVNGKEALEIIEEKAPDLIILDVMLPDTNGFELCIKICKILWVCILMLETCFLVIFGLSILWLIYTSQPLPFMFLVKQVFSCFLASFTVLVIQLWISIRISNQAIPLTVGVVGAASSLFLGRSGIKYLHWLPWAYPSLATPFIKNYMLWIALAIMLGILLAAVSLVRFEKSEFQ